MCIRDRSHNGQSLFRRLILRDPPDGPIVFQILLGCKIGIEAGAFQNRSDPPPLHQEPLFLHRSKEADGSLIRQGASAQHPENGGFTGAVAAYQAVYLSPVYLDVRIPDHGLIFIDLGKMLGAYRNIHDSSPFLLMTPVYRRTRKKP